MGMGKNARNLESDYLAGVAEELRLEVARQRRSLREVSRTSGLPYATLQKSVAGTRMIDVTELARICRALNVKAADILDRVEVESEDALDA